MERLFPWSENPRRLIAKLRTKAANPMPYLHLGSKYFYFEEQIVAWLNEEQRINLPRERELQSLARAMS